MGFTTFATKKVAAAAKRWSPASRRCSHSNIIFEKPIKTYEILAFLGQNPVFLIKSTKNQHFGYQILATRSWVPDPDDQIEESGLGWRIRSRMKNLIVNHEKSKVDFCKKSMPWAVFWSDCCMDSLRLQTQETGHANFSSSVTVGMVPDVVYKEFFEIDHWNLVWNEESGLEWKIRSWMKKLVSIHKCIKIWFEPWNKNLPAIKKRFPASPRSKSINSDEFLAFKCRCLKIVLTFFKKGWKTIFGKFILFQKLHWFQIWCPF